MREMVLRQGSDTEAMTSRGYDHKVEDRIMDATILRRGAGFSAPAVLLQLAFWPEVYNSLPRCSAQGSAKSENTPGALVYHLQV